MFAPVYFFTEMFLGGSDYAWQHCKQETGKKLLNYEITVLVTTIIIFASTDAEIRERTRVKQDACVVSRKFLPTGAY